MRNPTARPVLAGIGLLMLAGGLVRPACGEDRLPDRRVVGVSSSARTTDATLRENLVDLSQQLESLQTEVRQLRNTVDIQGHDLEQLQSRQRALYDDLDKRLRETERRASAAPVAVIPAADVPAAAVTTPRTTTPAQQQEYDAAFGLMKQGLYDKAIKAFRDFLAKNPNSGLADNAQYWIGEGNYVLRNYKLALEEYNKVLAYPQSPKTPDALLKIGYVQYEMGTFDKARKTLTDVQTRFPGTSVAKLATTRLDKMKKEGH